MRIPNSRATLASLAAIALLAAGCGKKDADERAPTDTAAGTVAPPAASLSVADLRLGKRVDANKRVADETDDFKMRDTVYASVVTNGAASNATLTTVWRFQDGQLVDSTAQTIAPTGEAASAFFIMKPDGLPKGKYTVTVLLNGVEARKKEFEVDD